MPIFDLARKTQCIWSQVMADYIPFVNSGSDLEKLRKYYDKPAMARIQLSRTPSLRKRQIQHLCPLWIDPEIDGYHHMLKRGEAWPKWEEHIGQFKGHEVLANPASLKSANTRANRDILKPLVFGVMNKCLQFNPEWITLPQLPVTEDSTRHMMNKDLAKVAGSWYRESRFDGKLVLPLIFTHANQLKGKTEWNPKLKAAKRCFEAANADIIWAVDSELSDWKGSGTFEDRFKSLIAFHTDLRASFPKAVIVAGPYWAMNLVLWARGLCDYPAIAVGHNFSYNISGGFIPTDPPKPVLALVPLRRLVRHPDDLAGWLDKAIGALDPSDAAAQELSRLRDRFEELGQYELASNQVAEFYGQWLNELNAIPLGGRSLALFQDLSSAYVLGKELKKKAGVLPKSEAPARDPGKVSEQLMLHCL